MGLVLGILIIQEVLDELLPGFEGTIAEYEDFDAEADCNALNDAIDRVKMDTDTVIDILCNRCNTQRMDIRGNYEGLYGEDLYDVCKRIRRDDLRHVVRGLLCTPIEYDAKCIRKALKGPERGPIIARSNLMKADDNVLIEILCARPNQYIEDLKGKYEELFESSLEADIEQNTREEFKRFLVTLLQCEREEGIDAIDDDQAAEDAQELYDAGEARWWFTDESVFTRIMAHRSWMQIRRIAAAYEDISGMTLMMAINEECSGETERAYKAIVRMACDPCWYFTRNIWKAIRGLNTDDDALVRNIIFTSEWGLETIKARYEEEWGTSIANDIECELHRGDYKDVLLAIVK